MHKHKTFFFFSFWPVAALPPCELSVNMVQLVGLQGTLAVPSVQGHRLPPPQELWPYQSVFKPLVAGTQKASLAGLSP